VVQSAGDETLGLPVGTRITRQRRALLGTIETWPGSFTVKEIFDAARLEDAGLGIATVYRTVELLRRQGTISALAGGGRSAYVRCRSGHHHHLVCVECGAVEETELCGAPPAEELMRRYGFEPKGHEVDIYGTCKRCAA
jgi:Fur family transcriptional regulator, ferric uptake regulator